MPVASAVPALPFDAELFAGLRARFVAGELGAAASRMRDAPLPLESLSESPLRRPATEAAQARAREQLRAGRLAILVLNGGMATRFGGVPKGVVPVLDGEPESFLELKLAELRPELCVYGAVVPVAVMHSFATRDASSAHLRAIAWAGVPPDRRLEFDQSLLPRVAPDGTPLALLPECESLGATALYAAPGHGDALRTIRTSGTLERLRQVGVRHLLVSNVDNLGAGVDAAVFAAHLDAVDGGAAMSVEVVARQAGDAGGCIAVVAERPQIIEGFRLPPGVDLAAYPHFNTNTLWFDLDALARELPLSWFPVERSVPLADGREQPAIQFEQLIGQASEFLPSAFIEVDRTRRFLPIKTRADLVAAAPAMRRRIARVREANGRA